MAARRRDRTACRTAAQNEDLETLKHAHEEGCRWDEWACASGAWNGYLECLKYLHEHGCRWNGSTCWCALLRGRWLCYSYACEHGCPMGLLDHLLIFLSLRHQLHLYWYRVLGVAFNKFASKILKIFSFFRRRPVVPAAPVEPVVLPVEPVVDDQRSRTARIREQATQLMSLIDEDTSILREGDYVKLCHELLNLHMRLPG